MAKAAWVAQVTTPPPEVPADPSISRMLTSYLRIFQIWALGQFNQRAIVTQAQPQILMLAPNGSVWSVTVSNTGVVTTTSVPLGQGP